jgi:hypothetical protein
MYWLSTPRVLAILTLCASIARPSLILTLTTINQWLGCVSLVTLGYFRLVCLKIIENKLGANILRFLTSYITLVITNHHFETSITFILSTMVIIHGSLSYIYHYMTLFTAVVSSTRGGNCIPRITTLGHLCVVFVSGLTGFRPTIEVPVLTQNSFDYWAICRFANITEVFA